MRWRSAVNTVRPATSASARSRRPSCRPGRFGCAVHAASVNYPDVLIIADRYQITVPTPFVPGSEFAGIVVEVSGGASTTSRARRLWARECAARRSVARVRRRGVRGCDLATPRARRDRRSPRRGLRGRGQHRLPRAAVVRGGAARRRGRRARRGRRGRSAAVQLATLLGARRRRWRRRPRSSKSRPRPACWHFLHHRAGPLRDALPAALRRRRRRDRSGRRRPVGARVCARCGGEAGS